MKLTPWRKREGLTALRTDFDDLFSRLTETFSGDMTAHLPKVFGAKLMPPVNISETEEQLTIAVELPGLDEKDIQLEIMGDHLVISGERKWETEKKEKEYHRVESEFGSFERALLLPGGLRLDPESVKASYKKGMLKIEIPKLEPTPTAKIPIKAG